MTYGTKWSVQPNIHMHLCNEVTQVWSALRLAPITLTFQYKSWAMCHRTEVYTASGMLECYRSAAAFLGIIPYLQESYKSYKGSFTKILYFAASWVSSIVYRSACLKLEDLQRPSSANSLLECTNHCLRLKLQTPLATLPFLQWNTLKNQYCAVDFFILLPVWFTMQV